MKLGCIFVLFVGIAISSPCGAETDLLRFNSPMDFTSGPQVNTNNFKIWTINSSMHFTPSLAPGTDKGINLTYRADRVINITPGTDRGIRLAPGIGKGINRTLFICNIV
jgi:hypothetical protein